MILTGAMIPGAMTFGATTVITSEKPLENEREEKFPASEDESGGVEESADEESEEIEDKEENEEPSPVPQKTAAMPPAIACDVIPFVKSLCQVGGVTEWSVVAVNHRPPVPGTRTRSCWLPSLRNV